MGTSNARDLHIDRMLTNVAMGYRPGEIIAPSIAPVVSVPNQTDKYAIFSRADALRIEDDSRSPGTRANVITRSVSSEGFYCENRALRYPVTIEDRANADPIYVTEMINGRIFYTLDKLNLSWEDRLATKVTNTSNVGSSAAVGSAWTDITNSDPETDLNVAIDNVADSTGKRPNQVTFSELAWRYVRRNVKIRNTIHGTNNGKGYVSQAQVAALLDIDKILIGGAYKNTGNEAQAESLEHIWADHVLISYTAKRPSIDVPSFMYTFRWKKKGIANMQVERHAYDTREKAEDIETGYYQDEKITGSDYGFLLVNVTSST